MAKKILMLVSTWDVEYSRAVISGISEKIYEEDLELDIFNAYDSVRYILYYDKDREIYSLPNTSVYDGLILMFNSIDSNALVNEISEKFIKQKKPVVSIDNHTPGTLFCGLDNYRSMYQLVSHMITIHDCRTFNYLGGPEDHEENKERYKAFCDCLNNHGITVDKTRVKHKAFLRTNAIEAYEEWKEQGLHMPDVVICANDNMALGYTEKAISDGILVPDYLKVTGFDNVLRADKHSPSITSVNRNWKQLGRDAIDVLLEEMNGFNEYDTRFTEGYICFNESCGCETQRNIRKDYNDLFEANRHDGSIGTYQSFVRHMLCACENFDMFREALIKTEELMHVKNIGVGISSLYSKDDYMGTYESFGDDYTLYTTDGCEATNRDTGLYSKKWKEDGQRIFLYAPLHWGKQPYGYCVIPFQEDFFTKSQHRTLMESLSLALDNMRLRLALDKRA